MLPKRHDLEIDDRPLPPRRLAAIWRSLDERDRFGFILALEETIADQVIALTAGQQENTR